MDDRISRAQQAAEQAVFEGDATGLDSAEQDLNALQADLNLARGRILHARFLTEHTEDPQALDLFQSAADSYRELGDHRGQAQALFMVGTWHQVIRDDPAAALPHLKLAHDLAAAAGDQMTLSYTLRHLAYGALVEAQYDQARQLMQQSTAIRRELGFTAGTIMNLLGLAEIQDAAGDQPGALRFVDEAEELAGHDGSPGLADVVQRVRANLTPSPAAPRDTAPGD